MAFQRPKNFRHSDRRTDAKGSAAGGLLRQGAIAVVLGIALSALFVTLAVRHLDWNRFLGAVTASDLHPWLFLSVCSYILGHFARGFRTRLLVSRDARLSTYQATNVVLVGYTANNILPMRIGELARCGMLSELTGISFEQSMAVVFSERLLDGLGILVLLASTIPLTRFDVWSQEWLFLPVFFFGVASVLMLLLVVTPNYAIRLTSRLVRLFNPAWDDVAVRFMITVANGVDYLRNPWHALIIFITTLVIWLFEGGLYLFLLPAFGLEPYLSSAIFIMAMTNLGLIVPSSPGFIGSFHFFCMKALTLLRIPHVTALGYAAVVHLAFYVPVTLWGMIIILSKGITFARIRYLTKKAEIATGPNGQTLDQPPVSPSVRFEDRTETTPAILLKLTEAALPLRYVPDHEKEAVTQDVAAFVAGQIRSLPKRLYLLFYGGTFAFWLFVCLRHFRAFGSLPFQKRVEIFNGWAYGKMSFTRQLFRVIRSTALLAFYEHPTMAKLLENQHAETSVEGSLVKK